MVIRTIDMNLFFFFSFRLSAVIRESKLSDTCTAHLPVWLLHSSLSMLHFFHYFSISFSLFHINFSVVSSQSSFRSCCCCLCVCVWVFFLSIVGLFRSLRSQYLLTSSAGYYCCCCGFAVLFLFFRSSCVYKLYLIHNFCKCIPI